MNEQFIRDRITQLRLARNVSEYQMSLELGQSKSYIQSISSGKALPSMKQLFNICDYFDISLAEFFDQKACDSLTFMSAVGALRKLKEEDVAMLSQVMRRITELSGEQEPAE